MESVKCWRISEIRQSGKGEGAYLFMICLLIILSDNTRRGKRETVEREAEMATMENVLYKSYKCKYEEECKN